MLIEKISAEQLVPVFNLGERCQLDQFNVIRRHQLFPKNQKLFTLFHQTDTAKLMVATDFDGFAHRNTFADMVQELAVKRAKSICYIADVTNNECAYPFSIWHDQSGRFINLIKQVISCGQIDKASFADCLVDPHTCAEQLYQLLPHLNEFNIDTAVKVLAGTSVSPIVSGDNINRASLFGHINIIYDNNSYSSSVAQLQPGLVHQANGGYLLLKIDELFTDPSLWLELKTLLQPEPSANKLTWQSLSPSIQTCFKAEPAPLDIKVILVGDRLAISQLAEFDRELQSMTASFVDFFAEFNISKQAIEDYVGYIKLLITEQELLPLTDSGLAHLLQLSSRWCEHNNYLSLNESKLTQLLCYCHQYALNHGKTAIDKSCLEQILLIQYEALNSHILLSNESIVEKQILLETQGQKIGQINGLSVLEMDGHPESFGEPIRITATGHLHGDGDITDVERKAELAGNIHAKAMMIIQGFFTHTFAKPIPLPLSANLVFEQSYGEIDGDSAALAGSCALLSVLAQKPIAQHLAVTGAIDQFGNVLAVGGINEKLEGFHRICQLSKQDNMGVLIPAANIVNLNLNATLIDAVNNEQLAIYPIEHIDQAIVLLMGIKAGSVEDENSLYGIIQQLSEAEEDNEDASLVEKIKQFYARITGKKL